MIPLSAIMLRKREKNIMNVFNVFQQLGAFSIIGGVLAVVATILAYVFIVPESRREKLNAFGKFLHDTCNFKYLIVEKILQALYIFFTADLIILGFFMLFAAPEDIFGNRHWLGGFGIAIMILGPILIRLVYELLMMAVLMLKNVISINNKLRNQNEKEEKGSVFAAPDMSGLRQQVQSKVAQAQSAHRAPVQPTQSAPVQHAQNAPVQPAQSAPVQHAQSAPVQPQRARFCSKCGSQLDEAGKCPNCDNGHPHASL